MKIVRWLGLFSYEEKDSKIFYGRDKEIKDLSEDIFTHPQTIIYGPSGIGKTSILRAGISSLARKKGFLPVFIRLDMESKLSYSFQIIKAIDNELRLCGAEREKIVEPQSEDVSLWEYFHANSFWSKDNYPIIPLIVIDQFEEIFTLSKKQQQVDEFFMELSDLCDGKMPKKIRSYLNENAMRSQYLETNDNYRLVISLREDFLARLEECSDFIPAFKLNRYSLQAVTDEQAMEIVLKPGQGIVTEEVASLIIKKLSYVPDIKSGQKSVQYVEPALLSLFCNELDKKRISESEKMITKSLLNTFGDNIIQEYYNETISHISSSSAEYLNDVLLTKCGYRDNVAVNDVLLFGVRQEEIDYLKNNHLIREEEWGGIRRLEYTHDVLCKVAKERRDNREKQKAIEQESIKNKELEHKLAKKKKKNIFLFCLTVLLSLSLFIIYWAFFSEQTAYFEYVTFKYEWPQGIREITKKEAGERPLSYVLTKRGALSPHWNKMYAINGTYTLNEKNDFNKIFFEREEDLEADPLVKKLRSVCSWEFITDVKDRMVIQQKGYDRKGNLVYNFSYSDNHLENEVLYYSVGMYSDEKGYPIQSGKNGANNIKITFDKFGYRSLIEFFDIWGNRDRDMNFAAAYRMEMNEDGSCNKKSVLDEEMNIVYDKSGNSSIFYKYENGKVIQEMYVDIDGNPCNTRSGYSIKKNRYDTKNRLIEVRYYNKQEQPVTIEDATGVVYHSIKYEYDDKGCIKLIRYLDINDNYSQKDYAYVVIESNKNGLEEKILRYGPDHSLRGLKKDGIAGIQKEYKDEKNITLVTASTNLDLDEKPCLDKEGVATYKYEYDEKGNLIRMLFYDLNGQKVNNIYGYADVRSSFDNNNNLIERWYYSSEGILVINKKRGIAGVKFSYDNKNNLIKESFFGIDKKMCLLNNKIHSISYKYDRYNNLTKILYKNVSNENIKDMVVHVKTYDPYGNVVVEECFKSDETTPISGTGGWQRAETFYDANKFKIETIYYDISGYIVNAPQKPYAVERVVNDRLGNPISRSYFDVDMEPISYYGIAKDSMVYSQNKIVQKFSLDSKDHLVYGTQYKYDDKLNLSEISYFGADKRPYAPDGYWKKKIVSNGKEDTIKNVFYYDTNDSLMRSEVVPVTKDFDLNDVAETEEIAVPKYGIIKNKTWVYEGYISNGKPCGEGRFTWCNNGSYIEGVFNGWDVVINTWMNNE